jgi:hypothetical protein
MAREMFLLPLLLVAACGSSGGSECTELGPGDAIMIVSEADSTFHDVTELGPVPLIRPIQGGQIVLVGVRVKSTKACSYEATGAVYDGATDAFLGQDTRELELIPGDDGWARPETGFVPLINVPVCPTPNASGRIDGQPQRLQVELVSDFDVVTTLSMRVVPTCNEAGCTTDCM